MSDSLTTLPLSAALLDLAATDATDPAMEAAVAASLCTLNEGVVQRTRLVVDAAYQRKHRARLRAALRAMAGVIAGEEAGVTTDGVKA